MTNPLHLLSLIHGYENLSDPERRRQFRQAVQTHVEQQGLTYVSSEIGRDEHHNATWSVTTMNGSVQTTRYTCPPEDTHTSLTTLKNLLNTLDQNT